MKRFFRYVSSLLVLALLMGVAPFIFILLSKSVKWPSLSHRMVQTSREMVPGYTLRNA